MKLEETERLTRYWLIVASRDHVQRGVAEGFAQASHGKRAPLARMKPGDGVVFYSGKEIYGEPELCQKFTAIGRVKEGDPYFVEVAPNFKPARRDIQFYRSDEIDIKPLIADLEFIMDKQRWGGPFRFGFLEIPKEDFTLISRAMKAKKGVNA